MFFSAILCMAEAVYFESRNQVDLGQIAVAQVINTRISSPRYPQNACDVVHQYKQFEYYWDGKKESIDDDQAHTKAVSISLLVSLGVIPNAVKDATHFDSLPIRPSWAIGEITKIQDQYFYIGK